MICFLPNWPDLVTALVEFVFKFASLHHNDGLKEDFRGVRSHSCLVLLRAAHDIPLLLQVLFFGDGGGGEA